MRAVFSVGLYHFPAMRAFAGKRLVDRTYEHHAKACRPNVCFRYDIIIAVKQFHSDNAPIDNKYDKRYYKYTCCDSFHVCSVLSKKHCTIVVLHFLISNYSI